MILADLEDDLLVLYVDEPFSVCIPKVGGMRRAEVDLVLGQGVIDLAILVGQGDPQRKV